MVLFCFAWIAFWKYLKECVFAYARKVRRNYKSLMMYTMYSLL